jgi:hypothetical protein
LFGARWKTAGMFAAILSFGAAVQITFWPVGDISLLRRRMDVQLGLSAMRALIMMTSIWLPAFLGLGPWTAVASYSLGTALVGVIGLILCERMARHVEPTQTPVPLEVQA